MKSVCISQGHGKHIRGAADILDEVDEARMVVETTATYLRSAGMTVKTFHDDTSHDQSTNLNTIVNWHNTAVARTRCFASTSMPISTPRSRWALSACTRRKRRWRKQSRAR